ncbi:hypothetical protein GGI43DRAFT_413628 [Trichoderma evansii]
MIVITTYTTRMLALFLLLLQLSIARARILSIPLPTPTARLSQRSGTEFNKRAYIQTTSRDVMSIYGYENSDRNKMYTVNPGSMCQLDTWNTLWGSCPTTITIATQCGFAGACIDQGSCSSWCGKTDMPLLTTLICGPKQFCSTAFLIFGANKSYTNIACGDSPKTGHFLISYTQDFDSTTTQSSSTTATSTTTTTTKQTATSVVSSSPKSTDALPRSTSGRATALTEAPTKETNSSSGSTKSNGSSAKNTGAIIGSAIGGTALLCFSGIAIFLLRRNRSSRQQKLMKGAQRNTHD